MDMVFNLSKTTKGKEKEKKEEGKTLIKAI